MKFILIPFTILISLISDPSSKLRGNWKLEKIELEKQTLIPKTYQYGLNISETKVSYNLDHNRCESHSFKITEEIIKFEDIACTLMCCDEKYDSLANYLNYSGYYKINDSILTIKNKVGIFYLRKTK